MAEEGSHIATDSGGKHDRYREQVLKTDIDVLTWEIAVSKIIAWSRAAESRFVTICNVHSVVTARKDKLLRDAINSSDMATPDGMPVAWLIGYRRGMPQERINGPDLTIRLCERAASEGITVAFYGAEPSTLLKLRAALTAQFPTLNIGAMISPPFKALTDVERREFIEQINDSSPGIVFIGLGCPKQEKWMAANRDYIPSVQIGVGAAFDYIAETIKRPPLWMQRMGLEWLGRLVAEPKRLWRRYLVTNSIYLAYVFREILFHKRHN